MVRRVGVRHRMWSSLEKGGGLARDVVVWCLGRRVTAHIVFFAKHPTAYWKIRGFLDVDGWLGYKEAVYLFQAARSIQRQNATVVEIGTWLGKSAIVFGKALADRSRAKLFCIDPFNADGDSESKAIYEERRLVWSSSLKERCVRNIRKNKVEHVVKIVEGYSHNVVQNWKEPIDLLFVDGNHEYEAVRRDFDTWTPFLVQDGLLVLDDVYLDGGGHVGPARIVRESVIDNPSWYDGSVVGTLYAARKR